MYCVLTVLWLRTVWFVRLRLGCCSHLLLLLRAVERVHGRVTRCSRCLRVCSIILWNKCFISNRFVYLVVLVAALLLVVVVLGDCGRCIFCSLSSSACHASTTACVTGHGVRGHKPLWCLLIAAQWNQWHVWLNCFVHCPSCCASPHFWQRFFCL